MMKGFEVTVKLKVDADSEADAFANVQHRLTRDARGDGWRQCSIIKVSIEKVKG